MTVFASGVTVTVTRPGGTDRNGDPLPTATHDIEGCGWAPRTSSESNDRGNAVIVGLTLFAPYGADITASDSLLLPDDDTPWYVEGEPGNWRSPFTGWQPGLEVALTRQKG